MHIYLVISAFSGFVSYRQLVFASPPPTKLKKRAFLERSSSKLFFQHKTAFFSVGPVDYMAKRCKKWLFLELTRRIKHGLGHMTSSSFKWWGFWHIVSHFFSRFGAPNPAKTCCIWLLGTRCVMPDQKISSIRAERAYIWEKSVSDLYFFLFLGAFGATQQIVRKKGLTLSPMASLP